MDLNQVVTISADVLSQEVGGETVLLDLQGEVYFGLDAVGTRFWQLLGEGQVLAQAVETMLAEYDVTADVLQQDLGELLQKLLDAELVSVED